MSENKLPPHDITAEESVLSAIMIDSDCIHEIPELKPAHFYKRLHGEVFRGFSEMMANGVTPDMITVPDYIVDIDMSWLLGVVALTATPHLVSNYAQIVMDKAKKRDIIAAAGEMAAVAWRDEATVDEALDTVSRVLLETVVDDTKRGVEPIRTKVSSLIDIVTQRAAEGGGIRGISTGYPKLDEITRGLRDSTLTIIAGRPGMGKTALGTNMMERIAKAGKRVLFFTLEMSDEQVVYRLSAQMSGVSYMDIEEGNRLSPTSTRYANVMGAMGQLSEMHISIDDTAAIAGEQIYARTQREMAINGVDIVFIDYLQLMSSSVEGNPVAQVSAISKGLQSLAKRLNIPVVAIAQLSRNVENRENKRPRLPDLRDSGQIEQDASLVIFIYRDGYYHEEEEDTVAEINVAKNRYGATGMTKLGWIAEYGRFTNDIKVTDL